MEVGSLYLFPGDGEDIFRLHFERTLEIVLSGCHGVEPKEHITKMLMMSNLQMSLEIINAYENGFKLIY